MAGGSSSAASAEASSPSSTAAAGSPMQKWKRLQQKWKRKWPWLASNSTGTGVGCLICNEAKLRGPFGCFGLKTHSALQAMHFFRHHNSNSHKRAAGCSLITPSRDDFQEALNACAAQTFKLSGSHNLKLLYCLHEAMRALDQRTFKPRNPMTLFRDERKGRIAIRFITCDLDLNVRCGTLGQARDSGTGAQNLVKATAHVMRRACTRFAKPPSSLARNYKPRKPKFKSGAYEALRSNIITMVVDAAGDELLASEMMRSADLARSTRTLTPNLLHVIRDKAHASRRLLSRPWAADPVFKEMCTTFLKRGSMARLVQNSVEIKRVFIKFTKEDNHKVLSRQVMHNFRAAGHRFESFQKPLGRTCLHIHSVIRTALYLAHHRAGDDPGKYAKAWLAWITTERCLLLAMMSDASDECMQLTRAMDSETTDPASVRQEIRTWVSKLNALFAQGACVSCFCYTSTMIDVLKIPLLWNLGATCFSIGNEQGVPQAIIDRCLGRMKIWVELATATVLAEFPDFEFCQAGLNRGGGSSSSSSSNSSNSDTCRSRSTR